jgi:fucose 4-O-acetylase-like acetyltransferase
MEVKRHLPEIDLLKGVLILLMITFHLVFIELKYPYAKSVVYCFHMPAFLIISGYLMKTEKEWNAFLKTLLWYFVPYLILESGYIVMASILPIREHIDELTPTVFLDKLFVHPLGPYWYLQTLIICGLTSKAVFSWIRASLPAQLLSQGMLFYLFSSILGIVDLHMTLFFLAGVTLRKTNVGLSRFFYPTWVSIPVFLLLASAERNLAPYALGSIAVVWTAISSILFVGQSVSTLRPHRILTPLHQTLCFLGRNTLSLFLFSPIFTLLCKPLAGALQFDSTGILFLTLSLIICASGSLAIAWAMDFLRLSPLFCGREKMIR